jgi:hypothetical protein
MLLGVDIMSYFDVLFLYSKQRVEFTFRSERTIQHSKPGGSYAYETAV